MNWLRVVCAALLLWGVQGCAPQVDSAAGEARVQVVATTSMVADLVRQIGGERVLVEGLMGAGVDPHLYQASASDVVQLQQADVIFYNGLLLEGRLSDLFTRLARTQGHVYAVAEGIPQERLLEPPQFAGHFDPHVWLDVSLWAECVEPVVKGLSAADPAHAEEYVSRGNTVRGELLRLHEWALEESSKLPPEQRVLITSHDAYNYFGRAYGFEVIGLQGISTVSEAALSDVAKLVDFIRTRGVKAIFVESSVPPRTLQRIAEDAGVRVGGELFSDAMGQPGDLVNGLDVGTYEGMIRHNLTTIIEGLR